MATQGGHEGVVMLLLEAEGIDVNAANVRKWFIPWKRQDRGTLKQHVHYRSGVKLLCTKRLKAAT